MYVCARNYARGIAGSLFTQRQPCDRLRSPTIYHYCAKRHLADRGDS